MFIFAYVIFDLLDKIVSPHIPETKSKVVDYYKKYFWRFKSVSTKKHVFQRT